MPPALTAFLVLSALVVVYLVVQARKAGPRRLSDLELQGAIVLRKAMRDDSGEAWGKLGSKTTARGLDLKFDHDDDPQAEASFFAEGAEGKSRNTLANHITVRLGSVFKTHHVHARGYVFRVRLRGAGGVVDRDVRIQMHVHSDGEPYCGRVENDDDTQAAVGDWIEFESVEILKVGGP